LISIDRVHEGWALRAYGLCNALEQLADRMPPLLEGKSRNEMFGIIKGEIHEFRSNLVRAGGFAASLSELKKWILARTEPEPESKLPRKPRGKRAGRVAKKRQSP
jgi:hypothetical protein